MHTVCSKHWIKLSIATLKPLKLVSSLVSEQFIGVLIKKYKKCADSLVKKLNE